MNSNNFFKFLINPFTRIAGWQAFFIGLIFVVLTGIISPFSGVIFDGALDMHFAANITFAQSFITQLINIVSITLVMSVIALIVSKDFRVIDILGTMTLARVPFFFLSFFGFFTTVPDMTLFFQNPQEFSFPVCFIIVVTFSIPFIVWGIVLMYNALKVSCNLKGSKLTISFICGLLLSEALSKVLIYTIL